MDVCVCVCEQQFALWVVARFGENSGKRKRRQRLVDVGVREVLVVGLGKGGGDYEAEVGF